MTDQGVEARRLFYEGTIDYKTSDFVKAAEKFRAGLRIWDELLKHHPDYRNDDINKKDTGLVVRRYLRVLRQLDQPEPPDLPFKELLVGSDKDVTLDPFDAIEMLGVTTGSSGSNQDQGQKPSP
jgi:hypothetical protein